MSRQQVPQEIAKVPPGHFNSCRGECGEVSIDYAVMEHTNAPLSCLWTQVTMSWARVQHSGKYINAGSRFFVIVELQDMIVVQIKNTVFVASKNHVQDLKDIVKRLKKENRSESQHHRDIYRPWGKYDGVNLCDCYQGKRVTVKLVT